MVYSRQMQATHCNEKPSGMGRWFNPRVTAGFESGRVPDHLDAGRGCGSSGAEGG